MAAGRGWGGASRVGSNHPALAYVSAAPPYPRRGVSPLMSLCLNRATQPNSHQRRSVLAEINDAMFSPVVPSHKGSCTTVGRLPLDRRRFL